MLRNESDSNNVSSTNYCVLFYLYFCYRECDYYMKQKFVLYQVSGCFFTFVTVLLRTLRHL